MEQNIFFIYELEAKNIQMYNRKRRGKIVKLGKTMFHLKRKENG